MPDVIEIVRLGPYWCIEREGTLIPFGVYAERGDAIRAALQLAGQTSRARVRLHQADGSIEREWDSPAADESRQMSLFGER